MTHTNTTQLLIHLSRKKRWFCLIIMLVTGVKGIAITSFPASAAAIFIDHIYLPLQLTFCLLYLFLFFKFRRVSAASTNGVPNAVLNDELRRASANRAMRIGFLLMLFAQPVLLFLLMALPPVIHPAALMACATGLIGMVALCSSMLMYAD